MLKFSNFSTEFSRWRMITVNHKLMGSDFPSCSKSMVIEDEH